MKSRNKNKKQTVSYKKRHSLDKGFKATQKEILEEAENNKRLPRIVDENNLSFGQTFVAMIKRWWLAFWRKRHIVGAFLVGVVVTLGAVGLILANSGTKWVNNTILTTPTKNTYTLDKYTKTMAAQRGGLSPIMEYIATDGKTDSLSQNTAMMVPQMASIAAGRFKNLGTDEFAGVLSNSRAMHNTVDVLKSKNTLGVGGRVRLMNVKVTGSHALQTPLNQYFTVDSWHLYAAKFTTKEVKTILSTKGTNTIDLGNNVKFTYTVKDVLSTPTDATKLNWAATRIYTVDRFKAWKHMVNDTDFFSANLKRDMLSVLETAINQNK